MKLKQSRVVLAFYQIYKKNTMCTISITQNIQAHYYNKVTEAALSYICSVKSDLSLVIRKDPAPNTVYSLGSPFILRHHHIWTLHISHHGLLVLSHHG